MYRITVKSRGKHNNVELGSRYCFTKHSAKSLIDLFYTKSGCDIKVEKFVHLNGDIFCWADDDADDSVFQYYDDVWMEDDEEE